MAQELQHLIDRIQSEAVARAEKESDDIVSKAREQAESLVKDADREAEAILAKARQDARQYTDRSIRTLEQVSRDLLITVGKGVQEIFDGLVRESVKEAMDIEVVKKMLTSMAEAYLTRSGKDRRIAILVNPDDEKALMDFYAGRYREKLGDTVEIHSNGSVTGGFRVSLIDEHAQHDFSTEAIAEAMSRFLRPHLSEIVLRVAREAQDGHRPAPEAGNS